MDKQSSLLQTFVNYGRKRFITFGPGSSLLRSYLSYDENEVLCGSRIQNLQLKKIKIISFFCLGV